MNTLFKNYTPKKVVICGCGTKKTNNPIYQSKSIN